jgi:transcriptional regulator with XRE-family HTH domain
MNKDLNIKRRICEMRQLRGYSQEYMAIVMGISRNAYRKIEKGDTQLVSPKLDDIARILDVKCDTLVFDMEGGNPEYSPTYEGKQKMIAEINSLNKRIENLEQLIDLQRGKLDSYSTEEDREE